MGVLQNGPNPKITKEGEVLLLIEEIIIDYQ